jgi:hypothetical protein
MGFGGNFPLKFETESNKSSLHLWLFEYKSSTFYTSLTTLVRKIEFYRKVLVFGIPFPSRDDG